VSRIEQQIFNDLTLYEVAMVLHTSLKRLDIRLQTLSIHIEKVEYDIIDETDPEKSVSNEKYSVLIISSYEKLTNTELMKIYEKMTTNAIKQRGMK
jgi:hypothetical protein